MTKEELKTRLQAMGQEHVLRFWEELSEDGKRALAAQIASLDWAALEKMKSLVKARSSAPAPEIQPAPVENPSEAERNLARAEGEAAIRKGEVGVILVAGGQGSRLGFDGPKGCLPIGPISGASLFSIHARKILALERKYGSKIPFYIMTSLSNDGATKKFFEQNSFFGLDPSRVVFFVQGMWPALDEEGRLILETKGSLFMGPDGHGGILAAMKKNGVLDDMAKRGLATLFYFQVDNPLVEIADPVFIGLHRLKRADMSVKVCAKRDPEEGLGVVVVRNGRHAIVEYTELTREQKHERLPDGRLKFLYGSVAIHVFSLDFLRQEADRELPIHVAHKKVPFCDANGRLVKPDRPNAYKFEKFIFDALPDARTVVNHVFRREDEFSPVKNSEGPDSPATAQADMIAKFARWLDAAGYRVPRGPDGKPSVKIEIDPCFADGPGELRRRLGSSWTVKGDTLLV